MTRRPNRNPPSAAGHTVYFLPHEWRRFKRYETQGGMQDAVGFLYDTTDRETGRCFLDPVHFERICRYCKSYGGGGPNTILKASCIPALRRIGIDLLPDWRVHDDAAT